MGPRMLFTPRNSNPRGRRACMGLDLSKPMLIILGLAAIAPLIFTVFMVITPSDPSRTGRLLASAPSVSDSLEKTYPYRRDYISSSQPTMGDQSADSSSCTTNDVVRRSPPASPQPSPDTAATPTVSEDDRPSVSPPLVELELLAMASLCFEGTRGLGDERDTSIGVTHPFSEAEAE